MLAARRERGYAHRVRLTYEIDGLVGRRDVAGAIYGGTRGLIDGDAGVGELQRAGSVGQMIMDLRCDARTTTGGVAIPVGGGMDLCAVIAAAIEGIEKAGPFPCRSELEEICEARGRERRQMAGRARQILDARLAGRGAGA